MRQELEDSIYKKFPWAKPTDGFGLGVDDGWYDIIYTLCAYMDHAVKFENECIQMYKKNPKHFTWKPQDELFEFPDVQQVKEKFGGLRFYCGTPSGTRYSLRGAVSFAEAISYTVCEICGNKGKRRDSSWIRTLCDEHHSETRGKGL